MQVKDLVARARDGDKEALIQLVMGSKDDYYRLAYVYLQNKEDALDALQDMIIILFEHLGQLNRPEAFYSWSKTILVNCCKKMLKKKGSLTLQDDPGDAESKAFLKDNYMVSESESYNSKIDILQALDKLNPNQQEAIKLRYFLDWDYTSIAQATAVPLGTVKSRISTGLDKLKELLGGDYFEKY